MDEVTIPDALRRYFWDYEPSRLAGEAARHTVVARLLEVGGWDAIRWLRANVGDQELAAFLRQRRGRGLSPKRLRFWGLALDLPREEVDAWIAVHRANPWSQRLCR